MKRPVRKVREVPGVLVLWNGNAAAARAQRGLATRKVRSLRSALSLSLSLSYRSNWASGLALVLEGVLVRLEQVLEDALAARVTRGVDGLDLNLGAHAEERVDAGSHAPSRALRNFFEVNPKVLPHVLSRFGKRMILFPYMLRAACFSRMLHPFAWKRLDWLDAWPI